MCGRYVVSTNVARVRKQFQHPLIDTEIELEPNFFVMPGQTVPVISSENPKLITGMRFGYTPNWANKKAFVINARSEGDSNKENDPRYSGSKGIIRKPFFRSTIRSKRCLVLADAFIEGTKEKKLKEPFLVYPRNKQRPFAMAGIWDEWTNQETGEIIKGFAIITTRPNELMVKIGHHRSPVILSKRLHNKWLNPNTPLNDITAMLEPFHAKDWNAFKLDPILMKSNTVQGLKAKSETIYKEYTFEQRMEISKQGFGNRKRKKGEP